MKINYLAYYTFALTASSDAVLGLEYLVSLKTDGTIQHFMDSTMSKGHSVKDFLGNKIGRTFSIGNFKGLTIELSSRELLEKLKNNPFVADVVPNLQVKAFEQEDYIQYNATENNFNLDVQNCNRDRRYRAGYGARRDYEYYDDDESEYIDEEDDYDDYDDYERRHGNKKKQHRKKYGPAKKLVKKQHGVPRHLARISRRTQLPFDFQNIEKYRSSFHYYYDKWHQGSDVRVYILDSGIHSKHCEFGGRVEFGKDFTGEGRGDGNGHGTHVAGIVGSRTFGVAKNVKLVDVKCLDSKGQGTLITVLSAIEFAVNDCNRYPDKKCVANLSHGALKNTIINNAIKAAVEDGVVIVVAAGNFNMNACWSSPASAPEAITVGAFDDRIDTLAKFSNWGPCVDIFAPGVGIMSLSNKDQPKYIAYSGTSMASPSVCGMVALLLDKGVETKDVKEKLIEMATDDVFQKRTLIFKPKTPNRILFNGIDKFDDDYDEMTFPQIDLDVLVDELNEYATSPRIKERYSKNYNLHLDNDVLLPFEEQLLKRDVNK
ncbi:hypothetical protein C6P45_005292 [Maudiozyma exigua]|uniref:Peptidase S8/S53 domain-containing protein n=1 Tax=Maudiozyma exigua TaxID=34358 RepID=A0A9P6WG31_MAUEX|nr:hypothetical protein C6P45_005292 [Kazachstania exigua]